MKVNELLTEASKGCDWIIQYQVRSKDADSLDSGKFTVHDYADKTRAKAAGVDFLLKKFKGRDAKITRVTEV